MRQRLVDVMDHLKIDRESRRLSFDSLRYRYRTMMEELVGEQMLQRLMGHASVDIGRRYSNPELIERAANLDPVQGVVDSVW